MDKLQPKSDFVKMVMQETQDDVAYICDLLILEQIALGNQTHHYKAPIGGERLADRYPDEFIAITKELHPDLCARFIQSKVSQRWAKREDYYEYEKLLEKWYPSHHEEFKDKLKLVLQLFRQIEKRCLFK